jgi:hypothetical protein
LSESELDFHFKVSYELTAAGSLFTDAEVSFFLSDPSLPIPVIYQGSYSSRRGLIEKIDLPPDLKIYEDYLLTWSKMIADNFRILAAKNLSAIYRESESFIDDFWLRLELYLPCYYEPRWNRMMTKSLLLILACSEIEHPDAENNNDGLTWDFDLVNNRLLLLENDDLWLGQLEIYPKLRQSLREFYLDGGPSLAEEIYRLAR